MFEVVALYRKRIPKSAKQFAFDATTFIVEEIQGLCKGKWNSRTFQDCAKREQARLRGRASS